MKYKGVVDMNKKGNKKGFTLVEIIVVLVILAILAAIAVPSVLGYVEQAKESEQLYKVRDALIASQTTLIRTYGTDGEFGNDNGSKNGTWVNDIKIGLLDNFKLQDNDRIVLSSKDELLIFHLTKKED